MTARGARPRRAWSPARVLTGTRGSERADRGRVLWRGAGRSRRACRDRRCRARHRGTRRPRCERRGATTTDP